jgi:hypothetical protein
LAQRPSCRLLSLALQTGPTSSWSSPTTRARVFAASGYRTGCFGKWHLGDNYPFRPQDRGFHEVLIHGGGGIGQAPDFWGNDYFDDTYFRNGAPEKHEGYCTDVWFDAAWDFIKTGNDRPFFVQRWRLVGDRELFDIDADPGQQRDVAAQHPAVVSDLRQAYEDWWKDVSMRFNEYSHIVLGDNAENPVRLSSFDWHTKTAWSQNQVRSGAAVNSFWAVEIARAGSYEFTLRRWPEEADVPITAAVPGGKAITANEARLRIGEIDLSQRILRDAAAVTFAVDLQPGKTTLQTWLIDNQTGQSRGAYYVYVRRLFKKVQVGESR